MAVIEHLPAAPGLPRPATGRMRPLRAGIRNVWEYDDQELWFADGRLILRGQNTAGKSKALELLLPFVLDGDTRSERLDPFGSKSKTMYWNLIEFADRPSAIGYCWVEFGHVDGTGTERYVTCIVGMRAVRSAGKRVETWFAVTPARVGVDLDLAPGGVPLTAERFRAALPERSVGSTVARDHRAAVDHALFGLGPERYEALVHLLLQLRRPKLSEKLDMAKLGEYLTDALPPLERHRMESLASAFARLDEDTAEIERLEASAAELHAFLLHYRAHAEVQTRLRADAVRAANSRFDKVTETERRQRAEREEATAALESIEARLGELSAVIERTRGQLQGLDLSKVHALHEVEQRADESERHAAALVTRAEGDRRAADQARQEAEVTVERAEQARAVHDGQAAAILDVVDGAGVGDEHRLHGEQLTAEPDRAGPALAGVADRRRTQLLAIRSAAVAAEAAQARIDREDQRRREAESEVEQAEEREIALAAALETVGDTLADEVARWAAEWRLDVSDDHPDVVVAEVLAGGRPMAGPLLASSRAHVNGERRLVAAERSRVEDRRRTADGERRELEAEAEMAPPARPGRPGIRPEDHLPLWACVDFAPELGHTDRADLEAALEASGLLDALVGPEGQLVDPDTLDTWIAGPDEDPVPPDATVPGLVPAAEAVDEAAVRRALATIARSGATVAIDGRWSVGPLQGRWSKDAAEYVGATARAEARRRRLTSLASEIEVLDAELATLAARDGALAAELDRLDRAEGAWPSTDGLRDAQAAVSQGAEAAEQARARLALAAARLDEAVAAGRDAITGLARAEAEAECPAATVDDVLEALATYRTDLATLVAAAQRALDVQRSATDAMSRADGDEAAAADSSDQATAAGAAAVQARGEADELRRTVGADADAVLARHHTLSDALDEAIADRGRHDGERDEARDRVMAAATLLGTTEEERRQREEERADALGALARLAGTELATLALGPVDPERDVNQVTAGLAFARSTYERLRDVQVDQPTQDTISNRFHNGMTVLRSQLGSDFDPYLDSSGGIEVCYATLNGVVVGMADLSTTVDEQVVRRRATLSAEERELIERHLLTEVGTHLGERVHAAWSLVRRMNEQLAAHPTRNGASLRLSWEVAPDAGLGAEQAVRLLRQEVPLLDQPERATLAAFLAERVRAARDESEGADVVERLETALDYRRWHRFAVHRRANGDEVRLTARTQGVGSGGEQAKLAHLPLFAATAAYYASARSDAPHLLMLDEAFAGIDDSQRGDCMGMLVDLDLDVVLTNYAEWGCYPEVPSVAIYHLERTPGRPGVTALRFTWDGQARREDDPWLDAKAGSSPVGQGPVLAGPEDGNGGWSA